MNSTAVRCFKHISRYVLTWPTSICQLDLGVKQATVKYNETMSSQKKCQGKDRNLCTNKCVFIASKTEIQYPSLLLDPCYGMQARSTSSMH